MDRYRSPESGRMTTMVFPAFSGSFPRVRAAYRAAPEEMPASTPSSRASSLAVSSAWVWVTGSAISWAYAVASATGAQGIVAGYGANLRTMFVWGIIACVLSVALTFAFFYVTVVWLGLDFYILPPK